MEAVFNLLKDLPLNLLHSKPVKHLEESISETMGKPTFPLLKRTGRSFLEKNH